MSSEAAVLTETLCADSDGYFGFLVNWKVDDYSVQCKVYEIVTHDGPGPGKPWFRLIDCKGTGDWTTDTDAAEVYLDGYIKWDGCSEFNFSSVHWCGPYYYKRHAELLEKLYRRAQELIGVNGNYAPWEKE